MRNVRNASREVANARYGWEAAIAPSGVSHGKVRPHAPAWGKQKCGPLNGN